MYTVDASVWVNAFDKRELGHLASRQFLEVVRNQALPIVVPNLVPVEVAGAISRTRQAPAEARAFATALSQLPHVTVRVLDEACALHALTLAAQHGMRGADAAYAAVALEAGTTLVTSDNEHLTRLAALMTVCTPASALAALGLPPYPSSSLSAWCVRRQDVRAAHPDRAGPCPCQATGMPPNWSGSARRLRHSGESRNPGPQPIGPRRGPG